MFLRKILLLSGLIWLNNVFSLRDIFLDNLAFFREAVFLWIIFLPAALSKLEKILSFLFQTQRSRSKPRSNLFLLALLIRAQSISS